MPLNKIPYDRQVEIESKVQEILLNTGLSYPENSLIEIIKAYVPDVSIVEHDFNGKSNIRGAVFRKSDLYQHPLIAIQSKQSAGAKTFALGHEFGHYVLDHNTDDNYFIDDRQFDGSKGMQDEGEANFFSAALLMPAEEFLKLDQPFVTDVQLADRFGVTPTAVRVRRDWLSKNGYGS
jgi:Zn-dependent peptidase ImmA (M78 family)